MSFNLSGYEKDKIGMFSFAIYTFLGCISFIIVIVLVDYYFLIQKESVYLETLMEGTEDSKEYKMNQIQSLNKYEVKDGIKTIPIKEAINKTVEYYND